MRSMRIVWSNGAIQRVPCAVACKRQSWLRVRCAWNAKALKRYGFAWSVATLDAVDTKAVMLHRIIVLRITRTHCNWARIGCGIMLVIILYIDCCKAKVMESSWPHKRQWKATATRKSIQSNWNTHICWHRSWTRNENSMKRNWPDSRAKSMPKQNNSRWKSIQLSIILRKWKLISRRLKRINRLLRRNFSISPRSKSLRRWHDCWRDDNTAKWIHFRLTTCQKKLVEEVELNKGLLSNHSTCESKRKLLEQDLLKCQREKEAQIADLEDQIRDLMVHMDSQHTIANSELKDEIVDAKISIPQPVEPESSKKSRRKKKWNWFLWGKKKNKKKNLKIADFKNCCIRLNKMLACVLYHTCKWALLQQKKKTIKLDVDIDVNVRANLFAAHQLSNTSLLFVFISLHEFSDERCIGSDWGR